jgi:tetratricopeptide (TPR) repeat protein
MADRLTGLLGAEHESPELEARERPSGPDAFAAAVAARLGAGDPEVAERTAQFLEEQTQFVRVQKEHLEDEHAARLRLLRGQAREIDIRRFGLRLRVGVQLFVAIVATVLAVGAAVLVGDAVASRRVVIEPFHTPPGLAARGIDGVVAASGLLDELTKLQDATRSSASARGLTGAWTGNIKIDVPETGLSLGEVSRLLRERFGHDLHVDGDLIETPGGALALTVRGQGVPPQTFRGGPDELDRITVAAAEYVYGKSQPGRWATYLLNAGRNAEAVAFARGAMASADPAERPRILNAWGIATQSGGGTLQEALDLFRAAVRLQPDFWVAYVNIQNMLMALGDEEGAWRESEQMRKAAGGRPGRARETDYANWDLLTWNLIAARDATIADADANGGAGTGTTAAGPVIADLEQRLHETEAAKLALATSKEDPNDPTVGALIHFVRGRLAAEAGAKAEAVSELEAFGEAYANPAVGTGVPGYNCWIAPAEEAAGHPDRADTLLRSGGKFVDCYRFRADILDGRGDWVGAQAAYAAAVALAPDLPAAYYSWGLALARHGDLAGAEAKLQAANERGPNWADPLKATGDVLAREGRNKQALAKYDQALRLAPNWAQLKDALEAVAKQGT